MQVSIRQFLTKCPGSQWGSTASLYSFVIKPSFALRSNLPDSLPGSEDSSSSSSSCFTYYFQPSLSSQESLVTSAQFWFYAGAASNASSPLFMLTAGQRLLRAAQAPSRATADGWVTYTLERDVREPVSEGPFVLQVS